jgi:hypothetical protein
MAARAAVVAGSAVGVAAPDGALEGFADAAADGAAEEPADDGADGAEDGPIDAGADAPGEAAGPAHAATKIASTASRAGTDVAERRRRCVMPAGCPIVDDAPVTSNTSAVGCRA